MTKDFLGGFMVEWHPPHRRIVLDNQIGPDNGTPASTEELGTRTGHFTGTNRSHRNYFFCYNQSYFIQASVPLPFGLAIGSLQFNKILCSVTFINCKLYT